MRIAFIFSQGIHYFYYDRVVRSLLATGHEIRIVCPANFALDRNKSGRALAKLIEDEPSVVLEDSITRRRYGKIAGFIRGLANYAAFVRKEHPTPHLAVRWVRKNLPESIVTLIQNPIVLRMLATRPARLLLAVIEALIPPVPEIKTWFLEHQPEVVFASPYVFTSDVEVEYAKAARNLGISVVVAVLSWDNLTSKGTFHVKPDWLFVWNTNLVEEAVEIHDIIRDRIFISGAPVYDPWFELSPSQDRNAFCKRAGIDPAKPFILYLCSSKGITEQEDQLIKGILDQMAGMESINRPSIVIRPHPFTPLEISDLENEWIKVFPNGGQRPDMDDARQLYYDSLYFCDLVVGINTTGFLEAAVVDKPCLTLVTPLTSSGQGMRAHFKHLMDADFIEVANSYSDLVAHVKRILAGSDIKKKNRQLFVRDFIRPAGVGIPAARVTEGAILAIGFGKSPEEWHRYAHGD